MVPPTLYALSDLHVGYRENRELVERIRPTDPGDWLIVAGDVGEFFADIEWCLGLLRSRFAKVVWAPGNHELWTHPDDPVRLRGEHRYRELVEMCRRLDVLTPEDEYTLWTGRGGPLLIAPLFVLYDYSFRAPGTRTKAESLAYAYSTGVVCTDESMLHPDPYPSREAWCSQRVEYTERRLAACAPEQSVVLVNHYPLIRDPMDVLRYPEFAQWCGTERTASWHLRFRAATVVYGHLHIPRNITRDGVLFQEVSLGYPREWKRRGTPPPVLRPVVLPGTNAASADRQGGAHARYSA
ncbi:MULTISPECIES: metallophosphoesterase family protein [unclassified Streptomyces]|uniref:metallophosphoesterase family protein n=1 Tax=unclassified Streptomyces TaxID=2593676 RepID=UPI0022515BD2|nr:MULTISPECIES: metallophosphoesterase [unclassified Streptomyces]WSP53278.1 metallophosphoesterase [Streptomyces sp. NBC_01241]MCX4792041.1 metallophosphoesterase [Streptomyces sp. NBC_01221]MCX4799717.1 metallophosphoesterase [Streptomyces sp. NBC_01242]WSJ40568.1 metallophosphoesterase [Streptomyces sp. NBC_01321]WSP66888.1 metallophosphoesterase [Streptomyces sp. NBC_01240]